MQEGTEALGRQLSQQRAASRLMQPVSWVGQNGSTASEETAKVSVGQAGTRVGAEMGKRWLKWLSERLWQDGMDNTNSFHKRKSQRAVGQGWGGGEGVFWAGGGG